MLIGLFEEARFGPLSNLHTRISLVEVRGSVWVGHSRPYQLYFL